VWSSPVPAVLSLSENFAPVRALMGVMAELAFVFFSKGRILRTSEVFVGPQLLQCTPTRRGPGLIGKATGVFVLFFEPKLKKPLMPILTAGAGRSERPASRRRLILSSRGCFLADFPDRLTGGFLFSHRSHHTLAFLNLWYLLLPTMILVAFEFCRRSPALCLLSRSSALLSFDAEAAEPERRSRSSSRIPGFCCGGRPPSLCRRCAGASS